MSKVVNLGKFRKAKAKAEKEGNAAANRHKHGRTKAEKAAEKAKREKLDAFLDGKAMDGGTPDPNDQDPT